MDRESLGHLLDDTHILVVDDEEVSRRCLQGMLESLGATVHRAKSQHAAVGLYFSLYRKQIRPRAVVTDWWLRDRRSEAFKAVSRVDPSGEANRASTAAMLIESIHDLDPEASIFVYTSDPVRAQLAMEEAKIPAEVSSKLDFQPYELAARLACHEKIATQRALMATNKDRKSILGFLRPMCERIESGGYLRMNTPAPEAM